MMPDDRKQKTAGWMAGAALTVTAMVLSGCSDDAGTATEKSAAADPGEREQGATGAPQPGPTDQSKPGRVVAKLVTAIIEGDKKQACLVTGTPATGTAPAKVGTAAMCDGNSPEVQRMKDTVERLRTPFTPKQSTGHPTVRVAHVPVSGGKAVVPSDKITVATGRLSTWSSCPTPPD